MNRINEIGDTPKGREWLGAAQARAKNRRDRARLNAEIPKGEREKEARKQQDIMDRARDTAHKNTNTSQHLTVQQFRNGADKFYRKNNYHPTHIEWDEYQNESKNMNKALIRLTEQDLHKIVKESVNRILNEIGDSPKGQFMLGRTYRRAEKRGDNNTAIAASNKAWDRSEGGGRNYRNFESGIDFQDDMDADKAHKNLHKLLNRSVKESVNKVLREGLYDPDDENEIFDIGFGGKYRVIWEFKVRADMGRYETISEGEKIVDTKDEAFNIADQLSEKYKGTYATLFRIEKLVKSLSDDRWENVYDMSNGTL